MSDSQDTADSVDKQADPVASVENNEGPETGSEFSQFAVFDETEIVYDSRGGYQVQDVEIDHDRVAVPRKIIYIQGGLLGGISIVFLLLGVFVGRGTRSDGTVEQKQPCTVKGRVAYRSNASRMEADAGAVVILLPADIDLTTPAPIVGLRPGDRDEGPRGTAAQAIREFGGAYTRADKQGNFSLKTPDAGAFFVLVISKTSPNRGRSLSEQEKIDIGRFFVPPEDLIEGKQFRWTAVNVRGDSMQLARIVFD